MSKTRKTAEQVLAVLVSSVDGWSYRQVLEVRDYLDVVARRRKLHGRVTYEQRYIRCGKGACRSCSRGQGHGPYWYALWSEGGKTRSRYVGKDLPEGVDPAAGPR